MGAGSLDPAPILATTVDWKCQKRRLENGAEAEADLGGIFDTFFLVGPGVADIGEDAQAAGAHGAPFETDPQVGGADVLAIGVEAPAAEGVKGGAPGFDGEAEDGAGTEVVVHGAADLRPVDITAEAEVGREEIVEAKTAAVVGLFFGEGSDAETVELEFRPIEARCRGGGRHQRHVRGVTTGRCG